MRKIRIKVCNFDQSDPFAYGNFLLKILKKYYEVEVVEDNPEYLFFNESVHDQVKYDCIKIFYTGENVHPNFNLADYAIGCDYMDFGDRYYRLPIYLVAQFYSDQELDTVGDLNFAKQMNFTKKDLTIKTDFCSFVYSNYLGGPERDQIFNLLSTYKKVNSGGKYLNNIGGRVKNKPEFEMKHKFSIAFENSSNFGYTTEKLPNALSAKSIPIYWGNPMINKEFNSERFINCHDYPNLEAVLEKVKQIDQDDELYLSILNKKVESEYNFREALEGFEKFLINIIDQPIYKAKRIRINPVRISEINKSEEVINNYLKNKLRIKKMFALFYKPFKKISFLEDLKVKFFRKIFHK